MQNKNVILAQIVGFGVIVLGRFGIELTEQDQADLMAGIGVAGLIVTSLVACYTERKSNKDKTEG